MRRGWGWGVTPLEPSATQRGGHGEGVDVGGIISLMRLSSRPVGPDRCDRSVSTEMITGQDKATRSPDTPLARATPRTRCRCRCPRRRRLT